MFKTLTETTSKKLELPNLMKSLSYQSVGCVLPVCTHLFTDCLHHKVPKYTENYNVNHHDTQR